jgi:glycosyltransferase involved in cell wall biosynthesis
MKFSAIIPVYNEEKTIAQIIKKISKLKDISQVIVVDDGSTDQTAEILKTFSSNKKIKIIHKQNGGKGSAVREGLKYVKGDYVLIQDADLEYDPEDIPSLLEPIKKNRAQVVFGSRFQGPHANVLFWHRVGNHLLNLVINLLYNTTLSDLETCYKVIPTKLFRELNIKANKFDLEPEICCKILKRKINIYEVPISYVGRTYKEGKKISWEDGMAALTTIIKLRFFDC